MVAPWQRKAINVTKSLLPPLSGYQAKVAEVFARGWITNRGPLVRELEARLAERCGVEHAVLVANGTLALQVTLRALGLRGSLLTTPFSFVASSSAAVWEGLRVRYVDIDPATWNLDATRLPASPPEDAGAVLPVHVFGRPCEMDAIEAYAARHDLRVVYDASHCFAVRGAEPLLARGDAAAVSLHATKLFHTVEGGAVFTRDGELAARIRKMINFGIVGPDRVECLGINAKMNELEAAMGLCLLEVVDEAIAAREAVAACYREALPLGVTRQSWSERWTNPWGYYPVLFPSGASRARAQAAMEAQGIGPRRYFYPSLDTLPFLYQGPPMPTSRDVAERILCLPLYPDLPREACEMVARCVQEALESGACA